MSIRSKREGHSKEYHVKSSNNCRVSYGGFTLSGRKGVSEEEDDISRLNHLVRRESRQKGWMQDIQDGGIRKEEAKDKKLTGDRIKSSMMKGVYNKSLVYMT